MTTADTDNFIPAAVCIDIPPPINTHRCQMIDTIQFVPSSLDRPSKRSIRDAVMAKNYENRWATVTTSDYSRNHRPPVEEGRRLQAAAEESRPLRRNRGGGGGGGIVVASST